MPLRRKETISFEELPEFFEDYRRFLNEVQDDMMETADRRTTRHARRLARRDMPSRGGSFVHTIRFREARKTPTERTGELYSDHQWAAAIEYGTSPHVIESERMMTASPMLRARGGKERPRGVRYDYGRMVRGYLFNHPGARPFRIFKRALDFMAENALRWFDEAWEAKLI